MNRKDRERIEQLKKAILELRNTPRVSETALCWGSYGILEYLETGNIDKIKIPELREKIAVK